jgi:adenylate cyclase
MTDRVERLMPRRARSAAPARRRVSAILYADVAGYTQLARHEENWTLDALGAARERFATGTHQRAGRIVATPGDAVLAEFSSVTEAVLCAVDTQRHFSRDPLISPAGQSLNFRVGLHVAGVVADGTDILGDGVNIAARIAEVADPGGICISADVYDQVQDKLDLLLSDLGQVMLRGGERRSHLYRIDVAAENNNAGEITRIRAGTVHLVPYRPSVAVLPFSNLTRDYAEDHVVEGLTDSLIEALASSRWFYVIARSSSFQFKGANADLREVGRALGARYIVQGSFQRLGSQIRVSTQLIEANTMRLLHSNRFESSFVDAFSMQDAIALQIAATVEPGIITEAGETRAPMPGDANALDMVLRAYSKLWEMTAEGVAISVPYLHAAIAADATISQAHAGLAIAATLEIYMGWTHDPAASIKTAYEAASRAVTLDRADAWAHMALGVVNLQMNKAGEAVTNLKTAVRLNPSLSVAYGFLAHAMIFGAHLDEAETLLRLALRLSPRDLMLAYWLDGLSMVHLTADRYDDAIHWAQRAVQENARWPGGWRVLAMAHAHLDHSGAAAEALTQMLKLQPNFSLDYARRVWPFQDESRFIANIAALQKAGWTGGESHA